MLLRHSMNTLTPAVSAPPETLIASDTPRLCRLQPTFDLARYDRLNPLGHLPKDPVLDAFVVATPGDRFGWLRRDWSKKLHLDELCQTNPVIYFQNENPRPGCVWVDRGDGTQELVVDPWPVYKAGWQPIKLFEEKFGHHRGILNLSNIPIQELDPAKMLGISQRLTPHTHGKIKRITQEEAETMTEYQISWRRLVAGAKLLEWEAVIPTRREVRDYYAKQPGGDIAAQLVSCPDCPRDRLTARELIAWFIESEAHGNCRLKRDASGEILDADLTEAIAALRSAPLSEARSALAKWQIGFAVA